MTLTIAIVGSVGPPPSGRSPTGGGQSSAIVLEKTLRHAGFDARFVKWQAIGSPDILYLNSVGMNGEKNKELNKKRLEKILDYYYKIPMVLCVHDFLESKTFKDSHFVLSQLDWSAVVTVEPQKPFMDYVKKIYPNAKHYVGIRHPWEFNEDQFCDRSAFKNVVANTARFASTKRSGLILEIAARVKKKKFIMASREKGVYWYNAIKDHPLRKHAMFFGQDGFEDYYDVLKSAAFMIDLTYFWTKAGADGQRTQHTTLEAINCGCIPINFDTWKFDDGYEAIWLPAPKKEGGRFVYDVEKYSSIVSKAKYDYELAKYNYNHMKKIQDYRVIAKEFKELFQNLSL
jgi:hypothetical protein